MTKDEFVKAFAEKSGAESFAAAEREVNAFVGNLFAILSELKEGDHVVVGKFLKFEPKTRAARTGRNPQTGEEIQIPAKQVIKASVTKAGLRALFDK